MRVPSSLGGAQPRQAYAVLIRGRIDYFHTGEAARETELHSTATDGSPTSQVKPGITARWWAFMEEGLQEGQRPTMRRAEQGTRQLKTKSYLTIQQHDQVHCGIPEIQICWAPPHPNLLAFETGLSREREEKEKLAC